MTDQKYMKLALELAKKGRGTVAPNPMVGAIIVKDGNIIGQGYHKQAGTSHAERLALASCTQSPEGATLYVTLEPCCHHGRTPPCTDAILESGIVRVVVGSTDPNPEVCGKGLSGLREHGIQVAEHICEEECNELNEIFFHYIQTLRPYVVMKCAMTMDGKIATGTGASKWITGEVAREHVHRTRHHLSAIMVGVGTVLTDDPLLTCRIEGGKNPLRIICDTELRTPLTAQVVTTAQEVPTVLATGCTDKDKQQPYLEAGCKIWEVPMDEKHIDLSALMDIAGKNRVDSILLEGGSTLNWSALESGIVQKIHCYIAPKVFGGSKARSPVGGSGVELPSQAYPLGNRKIIELGEDILIESEVKKPCSQE